MNWISTKDRLPKDSCSGVTIKRENGKIQTAYYHEDMMAPLAWRGIKLSHWTDSESKELLYDVSEWLCPEVT